MKMKLSEYNKSIDLPGEKRGLIPNAQFYDKAYKGSWNGLTVISISIGQGEVKLFALWVCLQPVDVLLNRR